MPSAQQQLQQGEMINTSVMKQLDAGMALRRVGVTKFFDTQKGFGFIVDEALEDIEGRDSQLLSPFLVIT